MLTHGRLFGFCKKHGYCLSRDKHDFFVECPNDKLTHLQGFLVLNNIKYKIFHTVLKNTSSIMISLNDIDSVLRNELKKVTYKRISFIMNNNHPCTVIPLPSNLQGALTSEVVEKIASLMKKTEKILSTLQFYGEVLFKSKCIYIYNLKEK